jgi:hypothetical protein
MRIQKDEPENNDSNREADRHYGDQDHQGTD